jgi:hypothetical protein
MMDSRPLKTFSGRETKALSFRTLFNVKSFLNRKNQNIYILSTLLRPSKTSSSRRLSLFPYNDLNREIKNMQKITTKL